MMLMCFHVNRDFGNVTKDRLDPCQGSNERKVTRAGMGSGCGVQRVAYVRQKIKRQKVKRQKIKWQKNQQAGKTKGRKSVGRKSKGRNDRLDIGR